MKTFNDYLPPAKEEKVLIQTKIDKSLKLKAHHELKKRKITWTNFIIASINALMHESQKKTKKAEKPDANRNA